MSDKDGSRLSAPGLTLTKEERECVRLAREYISAFGKSFVPENLVTGLIGAIDRLSTPGTARTDEGHSWKNGGYIPGELATTEERPTPAEEALKAACESAHKYPYLVHSKPCSWPACELTCKGREHHVSAAAAIRLLRSTRKQEAASRASLRAREELTRIGQVMGDYDAPDSPSRDLRHAPDTTPPAPKADTGRGEG